MKAIIAVILIISFYGAAMAAGSPPTASVVVTNPSSNPVNVAITNNPSAKKARQLLTTTQISVPVGQHGGFSFTPSPLDVSGCESIRFSLRVSENACSPTAPCYNTCALLDQAFPGGNFLLAGIGLSPESVSTNSPTCTAYGECSVLIQNPGTSKLTIQCEIASEPQQSPMTLSAALYCW